MDYQQRFQRLLLKIPRGKVTTYKALARAMGLQSNRQAGQLLRRNPEPDRYPCFKVVASDGSVGGYNLGVPEKIRRLAREGVRVKNGKIADFKKRFYPLQ